jgi:hypothetical protein
VSAARQEPKEGLLLRKRQACFSKRKGDGRDFFFLCVFVPWCEVLLQNKGNAKVTGKEFAK